MLAVFRRLSNASVMAKLVALVLVAIAGVASAEPSLRAGLTLGLADQAAPGVFQIGPQLSLGQRLGVFTGEIDYAYLSFFDPYASPTGVHRLGVTLRAELMRDLGHARHILGAHALFVEAGGAERFGRWQLDAQTYYPRKTPVPEAHAGVGLELDNRVWPRRDGWQVAVRFAVSPADHPVPLACRGADCGLAMPMAANNGLDRSVLLEWMFIFGG